MQLQRSLGRPAEARLGRDLTESTAQEESTMLPFPLRWSCTLWLALAVMTPALAASTAREAINLDHAIAQVTGREKTTQGQTATRDATAAKKKAIEDQYAALINKCRMQISELK